MSPRVKEFTERINVFFTAEQLAKIKEESSKFGVSTSAYVRMTVLGEYTSRETGHWIYMGRSITNGLRVYRCDRCHKKTYDSGNYCPNCGRKMGLINETQCEDKRLYDTLSSQGD